MRNSNSTLFAALASAAIAALLVGLFFVPTPLLAQSFLSPEHVTPIQPKSSYFRFKAQYTVLVTGEVVKFDLVRPCFVTRGQLATGGTTDVGSSHPFTGYFEGVGIFPKVTTNHHVILAQIPQACGGQTTLGGAVPKDLLPFTTWFDDADDLAFGWMYASEDAYKSPLAKIHFDGATIDSATQSDFDNWRQDAAKGFRSSKAVTDPLGFKFPFIESGGVPYSCIGVRRLTLPPEIRALARAAWPADKPRFWMAPLQQEKRTPEQDALYLAIWSFENQHHTFNDGNTRRSLEWGLDIAFGAPSVPTRTSGAFGIPWLRTPDFFPFMSRSAEHPVYVVQGADPSTVYIETDTESDLRGFLACYGKTRGPRVDVRGKRPLWRVDGQPVSGQAAFWPPGRFFENDKFAYEFAAIGL